MRIISIHCLTSFTPAFQDECGQAVVIVRLIGMLGQGRVAMMHDNALIYTIALGLGGALFLGILAKRSGMSPIVGYL